MSSFNTEEEQKLTDFLRCYPPTTPPAPSHQEQMIWEAINTPRQRHGRWLIPLSIMTSLALAWATVVLPRPVFRHAQSQEDLSTFMVEVWEDSFGIHDNSQIQEDYSFLSSEF